MGGQPSKPVEPSAHEKVVIQRLRDLQVHDDHVPGYVEVEYAAEKDAALKRYREAEGLPVKVLESWQTDILKNPKNK